MAAAVCRLVRSVLQTLKPKSQKLNTDHDGVLTSRAFPRSTANLCTVIVQGLHEVLIDKLDLWASPPCEYVTSIIPYSSMGLPELQPSLLQPTVLAVIMPEVIRDVQLWFQGMTALQNCVAWLVGTVYCCLDDLGSDTGHETICGKYMTPYLQLICKRPPVSCLALHVALHASSIATLASAIPAEAAGLHEGLLVLPN